MTSLHVGTASENTESLRLVHGIPRTVSLAVELTNIDLGKKRKNLELLDKKLSRVVPILSSSITVTVTEQATWMRNSERLVGISTLSSYLENELIGLATSVRTSDSTISRAKYFLWSLNREISVVQDRVGMVLPRIVCMLINEAASAVMENVAAPEEIDIATELGTNYPLGPIKWGNKIGFDQVVAVLDALQKDLGEDRYRAAPVLRQLAFTKEFWPSERSP